MSKKRKTVHFKSVGVAKSKIMRKGRGKGGRNGQYFYLLRAEKEQKQIMRTR